MFSPTFIIGNSARCWNTILTLPPVRRHAEHGRAPDADVAGVRRLEAGDHAHQRGLAAAGRPEDREKLPRGDGEADAIDGGVGAEPLRHVDELEIRRHQGRSGAGGAMPADWATRQHEGGGEGGSRVALGDRAPPHQ